MSVNCTETHERREVRYDAVHMELSGSLDVVSLRETHNSDSDCNITSSIDASGSEGGSDDNNSTPKNKSSTVDGTSLTGSDTSLSLMDNSASMSKSSKEKSNSSQGKKHNKISSSSNNNTSCDSSDSSCRSASSNHIAEMTNGNAIPVLHPMLLQNETLPNNAAIAAYYSQIMQYSQNIGGMGMFPGLYMHPQSSNDVHPLANNQMFYNPMGGMHMPMNNPMGGMHMPMNFYYLNGATSNVGNTTVESSNSVARSVSSQSISNNTGTENNTEVFAIPWSEVITLFEGEFDSIFGTSSCKAHLDVSEVLVDGAKGRWKHVLLLDTIVAFAFGLEKARPDSERRRFNQYSTLRECVVTIFHKLWVEHVTKQQTYLVEKLKETTDKNEVLKIYQMIQNLAVLPQKIRVTSVCFPWHDSTVLKNHLLAQSTAKSWKKREESVTFLIDKLQQYNGTLLELYTEVVNKLYYQHLCIPMGGSVNLAPSNTQVHNHSHSHNHNSNNSSNSNNNSSADANQNNKALLELVAAVESVVADDMKVHGKKRKIQ